MASTTKGLGSDKQNMRADLPKPHKPDLGRAVTSLAEDVQKVMALLYDHQKSLDGTSNPSFTDVRKVLKGQWEMLRSYLQQCHSFGADVLMLNNALRNLNSADLVEFLDDMVTSAMGLRGLSENLKGIDMSSAFTEENPSAKAGKFLPKKGKRVILKIIVAFGGAEKHKFRRQIYDSMIRIESHIDIIFRFWDETSTRCSYLLEGFKNGGNRMTNAEAEQITNSWKGYQEAIMKAIASIAMTCDAILVEAEGVPTTGPITPAPVAGEGNGSVRRRRWFHLVSPRGHRNDVAAASRPELTEYTPLPPTTSTTPPPTTAATPPSTTASSSKNRIQELPTTNAQNLDDDNNIANGAATIVAASPVKSSRVTTTDYTPLPTATSATPPLTGNGIPT